MSTTEPSFANIYTISEKEGKLSTNTVQTVTESVTFVDLKGNGSKFNIQVLPPSVLYNQTQKSIKELLFNETGYYIDDEDESGLSELHTLLLTCFATLVFLALTVSTVLGIRLLWKRYSTNDQNYQYDGILYKDGTSTLNSRPLHSHLLDDKNGTEAHLSLNTEELDVVNGVEINTHVRSNNHSNTNGSIITMTLKNNHLIVETEERNDLKEDSRETTMKYSPSARDGVFVVEVQQGVRRSPGSVGPTTCAKPEVPISVGEQCALVHNPPDMCSDDETLEEYDESDYYIEMLSPSSPDLIPFKAKTGLTQSNTSLSNSSYCYSNQQCYDVDNFGSSRYCGYSVSNKEIIPTYYHTDNKPKIMAAVYKNTLKRSPSTEDLHMASINGSGIMEESAIQKEKLNRSINDKRPTPETSKIVEKPKIANELSSSSKECELKSTSEILAHDNIDITKS